MAAAFINQVPASSYGFDFTNIHGWAFLYRTTAPPRLWQGWGWKNPTVPLLCRKTPGSSEAGGCIAYFQTVRRRRHLVRVESRLMAANPRKLSTAASSPERKRV